MGIPQLAAILTEKKKSPFDWKFFPNKISEPNANTYKTYEKFLKWLCLKQIQTINDFNLIQRAMWKLDPQTNTIYNIVHGDTLKYTHNSNRTYSFYDSTREIPDQSESTLVSSTHRGNIVIIETIVNTPWQIKTTQIEEIDPRYEKYIEEEGLFVAVDAAMKYPYFRDHIIFKDTLDEFTDEWTIGMNQWKGTNYYAETRILLEVFIKLKAISYTKPHSKLIIITDNLKLQ